MAASSGTLTASSYVSTGSVRDAFVTFATSMAFYGVGQGVTAGPKRVIAHGFVGGVSAAASGGDFARGFVAASFTKLVSPDIEDLMDPAEAEILIAGIVGGIASEIVGGDFANGAVTAAMAYAFNQAQSDQSDETPIDRRIGTAKNFVEITDEQALMIFEELGLGQWRVSALSDMRPFDQMTIDLAIDGLAHAVVGDQMLNELMKGVADAASIPLKARSTRHVLNEAALDDRFDPVRLKEVIDSRFHGVGVGGRAAGANFIRADLDCKIQGC